MKPAVLLIASAAVGLGGGAGGAFLAERFIGTEQAEARAPPPATWVKLDPIVVPVIDPEGVFMGYVSIRSQLLVEGGGLPEDDIPRSRFLNDVNRSLWGKPIGIRQASQSLSIDTIRSVLLASGKRIYGQALRDVAVEAVEPA